MYIIRVAGLTGIPIYRLYTGGLFILDRLARKLGLENVANYFMSRWRPLLQPNDKLKVRVVLPKTVLPVFDRLRRRLGMSIVDFTTLIGVIGAKTALECSELDCFLLVNG